jgi:hypothetical protein
MERKLCSSEAMEQRRDFSSRGSVRKTKRSSESMCNPKLMIHKRTDHTISKPFLKSAGINRRQQTLVVIRRKYFGMQYWINTGSKVYGPFGAAQLKKLALNGELKREHKISADQKRWVIAESIKGLAFKAVLPQVSELSDLFDEEFGDENIQPKSQSPQLSGSQSGMHDAASANSSQRSLTGDSSLENAVARSHHARSNVKPTVVQKNRADGETPNKDGTARPDGEGNECDLTVAEEYVLSGQCGKPWMMVPLAILAPILSYIGMSLAAVFCLVVGPPVFAIAFRLISIFNDAETLETLENSIPFMFLIVSSMFVIMGLFPGFVLTMTLFNRLSHNRSKRMSLLFGAIAAFVVLVLFLFLSKEDASSLTPKGDEISSTFYWCFFGFMPIPIAVAIAASIDELKQPYCESCFSYLKKTHSRRYAANGEKVMMLATRGAIAPLLNMNDAQSDAKDYTVVTLQACRKQCRSYLKIEFSWEEFNRELDETVRLSNVKAEGFLVSRRSDIWRKILTPVKLTWMNWMGRKFNW